MKETMEKLGYTKLYFRCVDKFIETGKTLLSNSGRALPKINSPGHLDKDIRLPVVSELYHEYRESSASFMLSAFFMGHLFNKINNGGLQREEVTVHLLKELLINCSARTLKSNPEDFEVQFQAQEFFEETFSNMLMEKQKSYKARSNNESLEADAVIRSQLEKMLDSPINSGFFGRIKRSCKCGSSADNTNAESVSNFRSQFESTEDDTRISTSTPFSPIGNRTRMRARTFAPEDRREDLWRESTKEKKEN